jgi:hypothetical protein
MAKFHVLYMYIYINSVPTSQGIKAISTTKTSQLMSFREIMDVVPRILHNIN